MVGEVIFTDGAHTKNGEKLVLRRFTKDVAKRLYMAWTNPQAFRYNDIPQVDMKDENEWDCVGEIADREFPDNYGQYFFAVYRINAETGKEELIGNCRFGKCPYKKYQNQDGVWDFGFSIIRGDDKLEYSDEEIKRAFMSEEEQAKTGISALVPDETYWGNGYITEVIATILKTAQQNGTKKVVSGADIHNLGSSKAQVKCGMKLVRDKEGRVEFDEDGDPEFEINIDQNKPLQFPNRQEIDAEWELTLFEINQKLAEKQVQINAEEYRVAKLKRALKRNQERRDFRALKDQPIENN